MMKKEHLNKMLSIREIWLDEKVHVGVHIVLSEEDNFEYVEIGQNLSPKDVAQIIFKFEQIKKLLIESLLEDESED